MAPRSSTLAWKILWMEEPGCLQSMGSLRVGHNGATSPSLFTFLHWRRKCNPLQGSCLENPRDGEPGGLPSMGSHRVGHDCSDSAAAAAENSKGQNRQLYSFATDFPSRPRIGAARAAIHSVTSRGSLKLLPSLHPTEWMSDRGSGRTQATAEGGSKRPHWN